MSARRRSCGVVTLKFAGEDSTTRTVPPARSTSHASSVARARIAASTRRALSSASRRKACGVWIAHSRERSWVVTTRSPSASLIVSVTRAAAIAQSACSSACAQRVNSDGSTRGRAASWTRTSPGPAASRAARTDSLRVAPPRTPVQPAGASMSSGRATTISSMPAARRASNDHSIIGRPASSTNAFGTVAPSREPEPAATRSPIGVLLGRRGRGGSELVGGAQEDLVEVRLGLVLGLLERVHHLGREDLLGAGVHLLLARREALVLFTDGEITDDLGQLIDVAGLDLVAVVLEAPVPVLRHLRHVGAEDREDLLDRVLVDHAAQAGLAGVRARDHDGHVVMKDLDREVLAHLAEDVLLFLLDHLAGPMMGIDHVVADLEIDVDDLALDLEILDVNGCIGNGSSFDKGGPHAGPSCWGQVCK